MHSVSAVCTERYSPHNDTVVPRRQARTLPASRLDNDILVRDTGGIGVPPDGRLFRRNVLLEFRAKMANFLTPIYSPPTTRINSRVFRTRSPRITLISLRINVNSYYSILTYPISPWTFPGNVTPCWLHRRSALRKQFFSLAFFFRTKSSVFPHDTNAHSKKTFKCFLSKNSDETISTSNLSFPYNGK